MKEQGELWLPLVDGPIGALVSEIEAEEPGLRELVDSPQKALAFRTFAYIRVGVVLGRLLMENEVGAYDGSETWVEALLREPAHRDALAAEVRAVADEIAADPRYAEDEPLGPDDAARERFRAFAKQQLADR